MGRWEPNARERLTEAAMDLYGERGFDQTTVADIAARAGLTERTFFRYFADKREVFFWGSAALQESLTNGVAEGPDVVAPLDAVAAALEAVAPTFDGRRTFARQRRTLIAAHRELRERELVKLAALASAIADALRRRGVTEPAASLAAEAGIAVFKLAFDHWLDDPERRDLGHHLRALVVSLKAVAAGGAIAKTEPTPSRTTKPLHPKGARKPRRQG